MNLTTIDEIIRRGLLEDGLPIHWYAEFLYHSSTCLRELSFDTLKIVNTANLPVNSYGAVDLPADFSDDIAVCMPIGAGLYPLPKQDWLSPIRIHDTTSGEFVPYNSVSTEETDNTGSVTPQAFFGRTTSSIGWFNDGWPEIHDADYRKGGGMAALLEARAVFHGWPEAGDAYAYVPGFLGANTYTRTILHNLLSPLTGQSYMSMVAVGCLFNTNTRSLVKTTPEQVKQVNRAMIDGLHA